MRVSNNTINNMHLNNYYKEKKNTQNIFSDEVDNFAYKVKNRLENGQPSFNMGMTSFTEEDWEGLMDNIDKCMESAKLMRQEQLKEESLESEIYNKLYAKLHS